MNKIIYIIISDILRNKTVLIYTLALSVLSWSVFSLEDNSTKGILTILNLILLIVPLVAIVFSTIYLYNSSEFIELLLSQPVKRSKIWSGLYFSLLIALIFSFMVGVGIPLLLFASWELGCMMCLIGICISSIFVSLGFLSAIATRDKARGIGFAILLWLFFALLFDGIIFFLLFQFSDYPIEKAMVGITAFNPIDLARIAILLHLDVSAMMGYTGAVFKEFFGTTLGLIITFLILLLWLLCPYFVSLFKFNKKDL